MTAVDHVTLAIQYARDVKAGRVLVCKWVRLAADRFLDDLARQDDPSFPFIFDPLKGGKICRFIGMLKHVKGPKAGQEIQLEPWQCFVLTNVFGWLHKSGEREGLRRFRRVYIEVPRGNAKSTLSSGVALYCLTADGEGGAEIYSAATTRLQAKIVHADAQAMARKSPDLMKALGVEVLAHSIIQQRSNSKFEALSAEHSSLDGLNIHLAVIDELHAHKTREVYDVLETGTGKRLQSLMWAITTAGTNRAGICYEIRGYLTKILERVVQDDAVFGCVWTLDPEDDWTSPDAWAKANPNWNISVQPDVIGQLASKAQTMLAAQNNFKTKHLCVWVNADQAWMDMRVWDRAADPTLALEDFEGDECFIGLDLASKVDIASKCRLFRRRQDDGLFHYYAISQHYLPEDAISDGRNASYTGWELEGRLKATGGDTLDFDLVGDEVLEDASRFQVLSVGYDPWQATQLASRLLEDGAPMVEVRQTVQNFSAPMKEIEFLVRQGRLTHDGDPVLTWMISNVVCHTDAKENIFPRKERAENKIDGVVALIMALARAMAMEADSGNLDDAIFNPIMV
jgi:phage terminase large subunit-like protein